MCKDRIWQAMYKENDSIKFFHVSQNQISDVKVMAQYDDIQFLTTFIRNSPIIIKMISENKIGKEIFQPTGHYIYWPKDTTYIALGIDDTSPEWIIYNGQIKKIRNGICE